MLFPHKNTIFSKFLSFFRFLFGEMKKNQPGKKTRLVKKDMLSRTQKKLHKKSLKTHTFLINKNITLLFFWTEKKKQQ